MKKLLPVLLSVFMLCACDGSPSQPIEVSESVEENTSSAESTADKTVSTPENAPQTGGLALNDEALALFDATEYDSLNELAGENSGVYVLGAVDEERLILGEYIYGNTHSVGVYNLSKAKYTRLLNLSDLGEYANMKWLKYVGDGMALISVDLSTLRPDLSGSTANFCGELYLLDMSTGAITALNHTEFSGIEPHHAVMLNGVLYFDEYSDKDSGTWKYADGMNSPEKVSDHSYPSIYNNEIIVRSENGLYTLDGERICDNGNGELLPNNLTLLTTSGRNAVIKQLDSTEEYSLDLGSNAYLHSFSEQLAVFSAEKAAVYLNKSKQLVTLTDNLPYHTDFITKDNAIFIISPDLSITRLKLK